jgi:hypothetical protein
MGAFLGDQPLVQGMKASGCGRPRRLRAPAGQICDRRNTHDLVTCFTLDSSRYIFQDPLLRVGKA